MFENLSEKLQRAFKSLSGRGRLTEKNIREMMREVRFALLEADVHFKVARDFVRRVEEKAIGQEVLGSLTPDMQVLKIVNDELIALMGEKTEKLRPAETQIILMVGLNGVGKTTVSAKLARRLLKEGKSPLLVAADVYRPAAVHQLKVLGEQIGVPVFTGEKSPPHIARDALQFAASQGHNAVIVDTAGRLQTNETLMTELEQIRDALQPTDILLVADATTGQEAVSVAEEFHRRLHLSGVVLTKLDGDARGGAALSIRAVTHCPIKFVGVGEKMEALEEFHPDRIASRILGRGDMQTLLERAEEVMDAEKTKALERKISERQEINFEDFLEQLRQMRRMGDLQELLSLIPGANPGVQADERQLRRVEAMILSMTPKERRNPRILDASRKRRIARGSGTTVQQVNQLVHQLAQMNRFLKQFSKVSFGGKKSQYRRAFTQSFRWT